MEKVMKLSQFVSTGVFIALALLLNRDESDLWLVVLAAIMAVNMIMSFFIAGKKKSLRRE